MAGSAFTGNLFLGHDLVATKHLRFWAERGLIHVEDSRDNSYKSFSVRTCLLRLKALQDMLNNTSGRVMYTEDQFDQAKRSEIQSYIESMSGVVRIAQEQGMPSDPTARRDLVRRRKTVVNPGSVAM